MSDSQVVHRSGPLKQRNKTHKHGRHRSKGDLISSAKGRVSLKSSLRKPSKVQKRTDRRNKLKQLRDNKRYESQLAKRSIGVEGSPPHLIVLVSLSTSVNTLRIHSLLCQACEGEATSFNYVSTLVNSRLKQRFTVVRPSAPNDLYGLLDVAMVADTLLLVYKCWEELNDSSMFVLDCLAAQGLPTALHVITNVTQQHQDADRLTGKALNAAKKVLQKNIEKRIPSDKIYQLNTLQDATTILRVISTHKHHQVHFAKTHPHLLVEKMTFTPNCEEEYGTMCVTGYLRGRTLTANGLVYLPSLGHFQISQIDGPSDPNPLKRNQITSQDHMDTGCFTEEQMEEEVKILQVADPSKQWSMDSEVTFDPMEGEQTWPTEDDLVESQVSSQRIKKRVPQGTSNYQAAWIVDSGSDDDDSSTDEELPTPASDESESESVSHSEMDADSIMTLPTDTEKYDASYNEDFERMQLEKLKAEREDQMFPDEIDTPQDIPARTRFQKYRGLKSFRDSPWDRKENLPQDYSRIFQFENFRCTKKHILSKTDESEGVMPGWYVTVHISRVPKFYAASLNPSDSPLVLFALLPHENKMSVVHFVLKRTPNSTLSVRSKDQLVFHTGMRRFMANAIFSQHTTGDKHKFERFFHPDSVSIATVFAPVGYPPQPVLVFKPEQNGHHVLVASGSLLSVDPDRIVCKRVVLSGHPLKIHKKSAVIRYMFFNRDDILWFKPIELRTKHGRKGHIKEPLGTHGHMKCVFDGHLKAQDTVLMNLYKRVFPKWTYSLTIPKPLTWSSVETEKLNQ